ncbi:penicillin-binding protein 2 [Massilia sp. TSP1-1-2]|uniref:penicillin-binding protein 2 n=1 Tax=Massilia sp. TSP1-1-2 TaxID=2804649 RepID=UPI003CFAA2A3
MTEIKNNDREIHLFRLRVTALFGLVFICFSLLVARVVWLQVVKHSDYAALAEGNRIAIVPIVPNRGLIVDRNGVVLARNFSAYTLEITPSKLRATLDSVIDELATLVVIEPKDRKRFRTLLAESKNFESVPLRTRLTDDEVARFTAQRFRFPGVDVQARLFRQYPMGESAAHVIGFIGRINEREAKALEEGSDGNNYRGTDHIGKEGIEKSYEAQLHGQTGYQKVIKTAGGRAVSTMSRTEATAGNNLVLSIDIELQKILEDAFADFRGALVAIEPSTGDVLAYVSRPGFDPNLFVDGIDSQSWNELNTSLDRPLLNRPLQGTYPPGSTFKPFMALAALELGKRTAGYTLSDPGSFSLGGYRWMDDKAGGHGAVDMYRSIVISCNTYYYMLGNDLGIDAIHDFMEPFGFGRLTGIDLDSERKGVLPSKEWKRTHFAKNKAMQQWQKGDTVNIGIGQGFNSYTILQLAHAVATLANDGVVMKPHLVKMIEDGTTRVRKPTVAAPSFKIALKQANIDIIKHAMVGVTLEGTGKLAFANAGYSAGGKTGTSQTVGLKRGEKYNAKAMNERFRDNSLYVAFAPADKPRIALALIVENAGFGAAIAAPIARKALDYHLLGKRPGGKGAAVPTAVAVEELDAVPPDPVPETLFQPGAPAPAPKE